MKNLFLTLLIWLGISLGAYAENNCPCIYTKVFGGANFLQTETSGGVSTRYSPGYVVSGSLGYRWGYLGLRVEAEYAYRRNSLRNIHFLGRTFSLNGHFQSSSYMANLLWDLPLYNWGCDFYGIEPFIGGGVGYDVQRIHGSNAGLTLSDKKRGFAWQVMAGLGYPIFCNTYLSLEYKFHKGRLSHLYNHSLGLGLNFSFGN